jgi:hypothetical protein
VAIWEKGYSTRCALSSTIVTTIHAVAAAIGCTVHIQKIRRCSDTASRIADALSKGSFAAARSLGSLDVEPARILVPVLKWVNLPVPSDDLADDLLRDMAKTAPVLNYSV